MKKIKVTVEAEFEIPDHWDIVDYDDGDPDYPLKAIKSEDTLDIFTIQAMKENKELDCFVSGDDEYHDKWLEAMQTMNCNIVEIK